MKLAAHQLEAFYQTAQLKSFTRAAQVLAITQSALSQRIAHLEDDLEVTLFIRDPSGPILTTAGETLLRYYQISHSLESEVLSELKSNTQTLSGVVRIAGFSSVLRSVIIPSLAPFLRANPHVQCEFRSYEVVDLYNVLRNAQADFVILDYHLQKPGVVEHLLGREEYVVIESARFSTNENVYLDQGPHDNATESFFREQQKLPKNFRRTFMGDVYGIINGVELGLGRAVMSNHLLKGNNKVRKVRGYKKYFRDVTLNYYEQPYYSKLHQQIVAYLTQNSSACF
jgi:DNA-binding transcriptional LysR family regulator